MSLPRPPGPERTPGGAEEAEYFLKLFISGQTTRSTLALQNIRRICDANLQGRYRLEVVDIYQDPRVACDAQIVAAPTLVKLSPEPVRRIIGDLSDSEKVLTALNLKPRGAAFGS
jgi:circadian clock protein KaiB